MYRYNRNSLKKKWILGIHDSRYKNIKSILSCIYYVIVKICTVKQQINSNRKNNNLIKKKTNTK